MVSNRAARASLSLTIFPLGRWINISILVFFFSSNLIYYCHSVCNYLNKYNLKLTCHHINRRHICFNIKAISFHPLLWMNAMLDFICMVFAELLSTGYKRKIQNYNLCLRLESTQRPLAFQRVPLTTRLIGAVDDMWIKLLQYLFTLRYCKNSVWCAKGY